MVLISKSELDALQKRFPDVETVRTVHKLYVVERPSVMRFLRRLRENR